MTTRLNISYISEPIHIYEMDTEMSFIQLFISPAQKDKASSDELNKNCAKISNIIMNYQNTRTSTRKVSWHECWFMHKKSIFRLQEHKMQRLFWWWKIELSVGYRDKTDESVRADLTSTLISCMWTKMGFFEICALWLIQIQLILIKAIANSIIQYYRVMQALKQQIIILV